MERMSEIMSQVGGSIAQTSIRWDPLVRLELIDDIKFDRILIRPGQVMDGSNLCVA